MTQDTVILVHGFGGSPFAMTPLARKFRAAGYEVVNWGYPSRTGRLRAHAEKLAEELRARDASSAGNVHVVGHSMGAIIAREALLLHLPQNIGRVVLMAPPLRGSKMADRMKRILEVIGPLALDMAYAKDSVPKPLPAHVEVGVLAARFDHLVRVEDTLHAGHKEHRVVSWTHTLTMSPEAVRRTVRFVREGAF